MPLSPGEIHADMLFYKNKTLLYFHEELIDPSLPTFIGIHGWSPLLKRSKTKYVPKHVLFITDIFDVLEEKTNGNFIIVNWKKGSSTWVLFLDFKKADKYWKTQLSSKLQQHKSDRSADCELYWCDWELKPFKCPYNWPFSWSSHGGIHWQRAQT